METNQKIQDKIIDKLQGLFKTDIRYILSGGTWLGGQQFFASISAFLISIFFANLLDPEVFGIYKYVISITSLLLVTTLTGMDSAIAQAIANGFDGTFKVGLKNKMRYGLVGSFLAILISLYYFYFKNNILGVSFLIVSVFIPLVESFDLYNSVLQGKKLFSIFSIWNIYKKIFSSILLIATIFLSQNIFIILTVYFLSTLIPNIIYYKLISKKLENNEVDNNSILFGKHLSLSYIFNIVVSELDKILVFQYLGGTNLAIYTMANATNDQIKALFKNINTLAMPKFAVQDTKNIKETIFSKIKILFLIVLSIVSIYILLAPYFYKIFFPKYLESIVYSQVLALSLVFAILGTFLYTILESKKDTKGVYYYNIGSNIFNIIILIPMIYFFGIWGAVTARFIGRFFGAVFCYILVKKI